MSTSGGYFKTVILWIYILAFYNSIECSEYLGCFRDIGITERLMKGDRKDFPNSLTPSICISHCADNGFSYAGLEYKFECFCSSVRPNYTWVAKESECDLPCSGNEADICGGTLKLSVYFTESTSNSKYIGCYKERSIEARLMPDEEKDFRKTLTPELCISHCKERRYKYAGLQYRYECFCSNTRPTFKSSADEKDCDMTCEGDQKQICGGGSRLSVYETRELQENSVQSNYLGCYAGGSDNKLLDGKSATFANRLTPELCVGYCYRSGYRYAALDDGIKCHCGDTFREANYVQESECDSPCPNNKFYCGAKWRNSVYHTQISDHSEDGKLLGCFIDEAKLRVLSAVSMSFPDTNSPKLCLNVCLQLGYKYAGVENGNECYCGNRRPASDLEVGENHCGIPCPSDRRRSCGGGWRILVYSTSVTSSHELVTAASTTARTTAKTTSRPQTPRRTSKPQTTSRPYQPQTTRPTQQPLTLSSFPSIGGSGNKQKPNTNCDHSPTEFNRRRACKGEILFKDDFVNGISADKWTHDIKMPWIPDYEFVTFQRKSPNAFVKNGKLYIKPTILEDEFVRRGRLELPSCTGIADSEECVRQAATFSILPPIESARISTKNSISFKYGKIQIRAKMPLGDWIVPEIWLEPKKKVYGSSYASGRIRIAMARGNRNLLAEDIDIGNRILESGILMGVGENIRGRTIMRDKVDGWHKHFHNYTLVWTPDNLKFFVDGEHEQSIMTPRATLSDLVEFDENTAITWKIGTRIAPFDQEFYVSLGLSVGGMRDFPDECVSGGREKPWRNMAVKAMLNFWQDRNYWKNTWNEESSALQVEHVRIEAL